MVPGSVSATQGIYFKDNPSTFELGELSGSDFYKKVFTLVVNSNNSEGFMLTFKSNNGSKLIRSYYNGSEWVKYASTLTTNLESGNSLPYFVSFRMGSGKLGFQSNTFTSTFPDNIVSNYLFVNTQSAPTHGLHSPVVMNFGPGGALLADIKEATVDFEIELWIYYEFQSSLLRGFYSDVLEVTISN